MKVLQEDFTQQIAQLQKAIQRQRIGTLASGSLALTLVLAVAIFFVQKTSLGVTWLGWLYPGAVAFALGATLLLAMKFQKTIPQELVRLDKHFNLQEQLRSAYDFHQSGKDSLIGSQLLAGASRSLKNIPFQSFYPQKWVLPLAIVLACGVAFFIIEQLPENILRLAHSPQTEPENQSQPAITLKIENLSQAPLNPEKKGQTQAQEPLEKRLQAMKKSAEAPDFSNSQTFKDLPLLQEEINTAHMEMTKNLLSQISPSLAEHIPTLEEFLQEGASTEAIEQFENELKQLMDNELSPSLQDDLESLKKNQELKEQLEQFSQEQKAAEGKKKNLARDFPFQETPEGSQGHSDALHFMLEQDLTDEQSDAYFWLEKNSPLHPGGQGGSGKRQAPTRTQRRKNQISKIQGLSGEGQQYKVTVQTLTAIGQAEVETETVVRSYEKDLQTVFQKENIPLPQRELVKSYFLAIDGRK